MTFVFAHNSSVDIIDDVHFVFSIQQQPRTPIQHTYDENNDDVVILIYHRVTP
jgi:hypothetical protein